MPIASIPLVRIFAGLDLGQVNDRSALSVIVRTADMALNLDPVTARREERRRFDLRFVERWKLGTTYPDVVSRSAEVFWKLSEKFPGVALELAFDSTGVGVAVADLLRSARWPAGFRLTPISIHSGDRTREMDGKFYVPKRDLIASLVVLFQSGALRIANGVSDREALQNELLNFKGRMTAAGNESFGNGAGAANDDLVSACAFASYRATLRMNGPQYGPLVRF